MYVPVHESQIGAEIHSPLPSRVQAETEIEQVKDTARRHEVLRQLKLDVGPKMSNSPPNGDNWLHQNQLGECLKK